MSKSYFDETHCAIGHPKSTFMQWMLTIDHKRIGLMYAAVMFTFFFVAVFVALAMRLELFAPGAQYMDGDTFNQAFTLHGVIMIFLFTIPGIPAIFGNIVMPLMIGAKDVSFPRLNWFTFWLYIAGCIIALASLFIGEGVADTGWTFYAPYSMQTGTNVIMALVAAFVLGFASILTGLNFLVTIHRLRAPGMTFFKMPLFVWGIYATAWIQLLATPVVGITLVLAILEKYFGIGIFDPAKGGDPVLFQHLFWIYSHPAVYLMILPAFGIMSEIIPTFSRKEVFGYRTIALSSASIAGIGYLVWGHHLYTSGMSDIAKSVFSFLTFFVAIPTGVKFYDWVATMYKGKIVETGSIEDIFKHPKNDYTRALINSRPSLNERLKVLPTIKDVLNDTLTKQKFYPRVAKKDLFKEGYIASKSGHTRGSTIDLTIIYSQSQKELDMGTSYDFFSQKSWPSDTTITDLQYNNRMMLQYIMEDHGVQDESL